MTFLLGKLPWALLAGSIAFNLAFLLHPSGGAQPPCTESQPAQPDKTRTSQPGDEGARVLERRLAMDDQQKKLFAQLRNDTQEKAKAIRQSMLANRKELLDMMAGDSSDPAKVEELIKQDAEYVRQLRVLAMEHTAKLMRTLSPQQRQKLLEILHKRELAPMHGFGPNGPASRPFGAGPGPASRPFDPERIRQWHERREHEQMKDSHPETQPAEGK
jgi:Spy/CpxP family protein refolding chaperone